MIPAEAVEAVAKALFGHRGRGWDIMERLTCESQARRALEAASPYVRAAEMLSGVQREIDDAQSMTDVLVAHQRQNSSRCLCGWAKLGHSHPEHVAEALTTAGFGMVAK